MTSTWKSCRWGDIATLEYGKALRDYQDGVGEFPVYGTNGRIGWHESALTDEPGVIVGRKGAYRGIHFSGRPFFVIDTAFYLKPKAGVDPRWAYYELLTKDINGMDTGSAIPSTTRQSFYALPVQVPPPNEQRAIAGVLGALDDKIELNRRMSETLSRFAFEYFRCAYWRSPDRGAWSEERLGEHLEVVRGLSYAGAGLTADGLPLHNLNSIYEGGGYKRSGLKRYSGNFKERHVVHAGDVIVANTDLTWNFEVIASPALIPGHYGVGGLFSHHLYRVRPKRSSPLTPALVYLMLLAGPLRREVAGYANGTTVNMLPQDALERPRFRVPSFERAREIELLVTPLFARAEAAETESETLAELRDALLPKLISGELRVRDAERRAEQARSLSPLAGRGRARP